MILKDYSKKGQAGWLLLVIGLLLIGSIFILTFIATNHFLLKNVDEMVQDDNSFSNVTKNSINELTNKNNTSWDNAFAWFIGGLLIGLFFAGATFNNSPVMIIVVLLLLVVCVYIAMNIVNVYEELEADTVEDLDFQTNFPKAHYIMSNLVMVIIGGISLFAIGIFLSERVGL